MTSSCAVETSRSMADWASSEDFRKFWARHEVVRRADGPARLHHPEVGDLELHRGKLIVAGTQDQTLVIYHAEPGDNRKGPADRSPRPGHWTQVAQRAHQLRPTRSHQ
jgi:hypothetical protein